MIRRLLAPVVAAVAVTVTGTAGALAAGPPDHQVKTKTICVNHDYRRLANGMVLRNDDFGPGAATCLTNTDDGPDYTITRSVMPTAAWNAYPDLFTGSLWGIHSRQTPLPEQVRGIKAARITLDGRTRNLTGNLSIDAWLNQSNYFQSQATAAEVMVWASWPGEPPHYATRVLVNGVPYLFEHWRTQSPPALINPLTGKTYRWLYCQFRPASGQTTDLHVNFAAILHWLVRHRYVKPWWWLGSIGAGNEVVSGGKGTTVTRFAVTWHPRVLLRPAPVEWVTEAVQA